MGRFPDDDRRPAADTSELELTLGTIVALLKRSLCIDEAYLLLVDGDDMVTVATWSPRPAALRTGARVHVSAHALEPLLSRTSSTFCGEATVDGFLPLLDRVLAAAGSRSWVTCPLMSAGSVAGMLVLAGTVPGSPGPSDELYFRLIASLFEDQLLRLGNDALASLATSGATRRSA